MKLKFKHLIQIKINIKLISQTATLKQIAVLFFAIYKINKNLIKYY